MPARNINLWIGADHREVYRAGDAAGAPVDLTGYDLIFRALNHLDEQVIRVPLLIQSAMPSDVQSAVLAKYSALTGCYCLELPPAQTRLFRVGGQYRYEIEPRIGGRQLRPWVWGAIVPAGGVNDD